MQLGVEVNSDLATHDDAKARLLEAIHRETDRKIVFLIGSGMSVPAIPSTKLLCKSLELALGGTWEAPTDQWGERYRWLANKLKVRKGPKALASVIREAVLSACPNGSAGTPAISASEWTVPKQQTALASLIGCISQERRAAVLTTNFDPLTEVALHRVGIPATTFNAAGPGFPELDTVLNTLPVIHLHGYWESGATLSTDSELLLARGEVESRLMDLFDNSILVVAGYGGWEDSFTRSLSALVRTSKFSLLQSEILWLHHGPASSSPAVMSMRGTPAFLEYENVDAQSLFQTLADMIGAHDQTPSLSVRGFTRLRKPLSATVPSQGELLRFAEGAQPTLRIAPIAPALQSATRLAKIALQPAQDDRYVVAIGPTGEGKSTALLQAALAYQPGDDRIVVLRDAGGPLLTKTDVSKFRERYAHTVLVVDEADLMLDSLVPAIRESHESNNGRITTLLSMHSQYEGRLRRYISKSEDWTLVPFHGLTQDDADRLATFWLDNDLLPAQYRNTEMQSVSEMVVGASLGVSENTLLGAMLHLWSSEDLADRVKHLLARLDRYELAGQSFKDIYQQICVVHYFWRDADAPYDTGYPVAGLGRALDIDAGDVTRLLLAPMGREAAVAQVGDTVFARHDAIAEVVVTEMSDSELRRHCLEIARTGALVRRASGSRAHAESRSLTLLCRRLQGQLAIDTARKVMVTSELLESRVTYLRVCREEGRAAWATKYAEQLAQHTKEYSDYRTSARGLFVEWGMNELALGNFSRAAALSVRSLTDAVPGTIDPDQLRYGLVTAARACARLPRSPLHARIRRAALNLLLLLPKASEVAPEIRGWSLPKKSLYLLVQDFREASLLLAKTELDVGIGEWSFRKSLALASSLNVLSRGDSGRQGK